MRPESKSSQVGSGAGTSLPHAETPNPPDARMRTARGFLLGLAIGALFWIIALAALLIWISTS